MIGTGTDGPLHGPAPTAEVRRVLDVSRTFLADLDLNLVQSRVLEAAREVAHARYAALGVRNRSGRGFDQFLTAGVDPERRAQFGPEPTGHGLLGELIRHPRSLRVPEIGLHPHSYGFPSGHPPMHTFLGVPVLIGTEHYATLYATEKLAGSEFTEADQEALELLAQLAGIAIDHARRYGGIEARRADLELSLRELDASLQMTRAVGRNSNAEAVVETVAKRARALVGARTIVVETRHGDKMVVTAVAGAAPAGLVGHATDVRDSFAGEALLSAQTRRLEDDLHQRQFQEHGLGQSGLTAEAGLAVPLIFRDRPIGALVAIDRVVRGPSFTAQDERVLEAFGVSAATAITTAGAIRLQRRREQLAATEQERGRWARELHDETLPDLAALRLRMSRSLRDDEPEALRALLVDAVDQLDGTIASVRAIVSDLRPVALERVGIRKALQRLTERLGDEGLTVDLRIDVPEAGEEIEGCGELASTVYRICQEALTNVRKHASATHASVEIELVDETITITVRDDGVGFLPTTEPNGFGITSMRERAELVDGRLTISSAPGHGTTVSVAIPCPGFPTGGQDQPHLDQPGRECPSARDDAGAPRSGSSQPARRRRGNTRPGGKRTSSHD